MILKILFELYIGFLGSIPTSLGVRIRYYGYKTLFKKTDGFFRIDRGVTITDFKNIELGKNINIMKNSYLYAHDDGVLVIGNNFSMNTNTQLGASGGKIVIGDDCSIGPNCVLRAADHEFSNPDIPFNQQGHKYGEIIIENDVWIASNCVITANTAIGTGSVIAAGSVVTKDVESFSVMGGVPAKLIKKRG
ncbi:transferase hexapeptide repeat containing protein [Sulfuricurvum kujiense DSM 16994]|uniref:Transferase hexapeptide repeat containing protein n=1 Tax=Sulfuricurvum kujiense (strain ATCC BAA-921 / DSM 16994 / JCM 11577 / YK-1) TaxID=709032 RepID=E4TYB0_SULKY|nr:acyltransferase [Sulfuricurvum kujiense]ADR35055.1 transferase hexapeptide repeat containing protein [Sulfuricurvum kujiense DSM 16994]